MDNSNAVALAALGVLASCIACVVWVVRTVLGRVAPALDKHSRSADNISATVKKLDGSIKSFDTYLRERNGRDNEMFTAQIAAMKSLKDNFSAMTESTHEKDSEILKEIRQIKIKTQDVKTQHVHKQVVDETNAITPE